MVTKRKQRRRAKQRNLDRTAKIIAERLFAFYYKEAIKTDLMLHNNGSCRVFYVSDFADVQQQMTASKPSEGE